MLSNTSDDLLKFCNIECGKIVCIWNALAAVNDMTAVVFKLGIERGSS